MSAPVRRALVSVFDKTGVLALCRELRAAGVELLGSGGTAKLLRDNDVSVIEVADYTGSPELLDGRVKTLHPRIHAGILAIRASSDHMRQLEREQIAPIDLVVVNLYPFASTVASGASFADVVEMIDVGGPTMVRSAAKNHADVTVVVDPADYSAVASAIRTHGGVAATERLRLAAKAFSHTSAYDAAVHAYLDTHVRGDAHGRGDAPPAASIFPDSLALTFAKVHDLRYGENPHQRAAFYVEPGGGGTSVVRAAQLQGKELSFNNLLDFDAALGLAADLARGACVIVKHGNPCGAALREAPAESFRAAFACDPVSAFGGVIAFHAPVDRAGAVAITEGFYEGVAAPAFDDAALEVFASKKNLRLLQTGPLEALDRSGWDLRRVRGGLLVQEPDLAGSPVREGRVATQRAPSEDEWRAMEFAWTVARHVKSNAIVYALADRTVGIGAGQMSRVDSARIAVQKACSSLRGTAAGSDAFFPFRDGIDVAADAGVSAVVQPGGSVRDDEVIAAANERGMTMVLTGRRHFRH